MNPAGNAVGAVATVVYGEALVDDFATEQVVGGAPFNVARHLAAFMAPSLMITRVGNDRNGDIIRAEFERFAMSQAGLQVDAIEETGRVLVERTPKGHRFVIVPHQAYDVIEPEAALAAMAGLSPDTIYFGTLAQRGERSRSALRTVLAASAATRFLDLNLRDGQVERRVVLDSLHAADIAKLNEEELQTLLEWTFQYGPGDPPLAPGDTRSACAALVKMFGLQAMVVTLGHRGSVYFGADGSTVDTRDTPAPPYVIDTVGAGDAFSAIFLLGRLRGWPLERTLARANAFAGAICAIPGAVPRDLGFYDGWVARWR
ncbi:fructokinase [Massilia sp. Dwa41.01b]|uniref:PfkB family carbohydrate kinase n=1 Tax=unclassified Massilia TaxID=2609279 RepID=UPI0016016B4D|nr:MULTISPECIES: PfkB family carbohydrate kinase [unclassified Massilia]QNA87557.1 fructokinase [Massilia sp. Dwa41.01b]QNA98467.1 fructokinase [Massilia sp. Se16.2.3]